MSEYQQYYDEFHSGYWADPNPKLCRCHGSGWALSELDTWHECHIHHTPGQRHPEDDSEPTPLPDGFIAPTVPQMDDSDISFDDNDIPF